MDDGIPPRRIPLKIVPDEIAVPPGTATIQFGPGVAQLANGNTFQISAGSITFTWDPGSAVNAEMIRRLDEVIRRERQALRSAGCALEDFASAIQTGIPLGPAEKDKTDSLTGVN